MAQQMDPSFKLKRFGIPRSPHGQQWDFLTEVLLQGFCCSPLPCSRCGVLCRCPTADQNYRNKGITVPTLVELRKWVTANHISFSCNILAEFLGIAPKSDQKGQLVFIICPSRSAQYFELCHKSGNLSHCRCV